MREKAVQMEMAAQVNMRQQRKSLKSAGPELNLRWTNPSDQHVGGYTEDNITREEDGDTGLVLGVVESKVSGQGGQFGEGNGISVKADVSWSVRGTY